MSVKLSNNRGIIYDRNLIPFVETELAEYAVIYPEYILNKTETARLLKKITGKDILIKLSEKNPFSIEIINDNEAAFQKLESNNVIIINTKKRYGNTNLARHIIGYVSPIDNHGKSGVEIICDKYLYSKREKSIGIISNAWQDSIGEFEPRYLDENYFDGEFDIKLTLDYHIQKIVEDEMNRNAIRGAAVVLDVESGDVLAMASKPDFEQDSIEKYINKNGTELINRAMKPFNVGSIFKIITASSAMQEFKAFMSDYFYCSGGKDLNGHLFRCAYPHGYLSLQDAFSVSCNSAFIELGIRTGKTSLISTAKKFGLGENTNLYNQGFSESPGKLPIGEFTSSKEIANLSIGQGEVLATPLQIASVVSTIANDGVKKRINLIDSVMDSKAGKIKELKSVGRKRVVSIETAWKIKRMMETVTEKGTGKKANVPEYGGTAGKTGTAQTGWKEGETTKVHAWFAGYFPRENIKYAAVVFVENGKSGANTAAPAFGNIAREIMKLGER
ncbi:MAG: peptidoglycan D,D-transpeptidase FtsI family protein [Ignavibacteriales bacterium]